MRRETGQPLQEGRTRPAPRGGSLGQHLERRTQPAPRREDMAGLALVGTHTASTGEEGVAGPRGEDRGVWASWGCTRPTLAGDALGAHALGRGEALGRDALGGDALGRRGQPWGHTPGAGGSPGGKCPGEEGPALGAHARGRAAAGLTW